MRFSIERAKSRLRLCSDQSHRPVLEFTSLSSPVTLAPLLLQALNDLHRRRACALLVAFGAIGTKPPAFLHVVALFIAEFVFPDLLVDNFELDVVVGTAAVHLRFTFGIASSSHRNL